MAVNLSEAVMSLGRKRCNLNGILERLAGELGPNMKTVATGGQGHMITRASRWVKVYEEDLTLDGLSWIWHLNNP